MRAQHRKALLAVLASGHCFVASTLVRAGETTNPPSGDSERPADRPPESRPRWELGAGLGYLSLPHYRGSDQREDYAAPVPYIRYRGERLKVDREGGRYHFIDRAEWKLEMSAAFVFPVDSEDNRARAGMPDLGPILEVGPGLRWFLYASADQRFRVRAALPVRLAVNLSGLRSTGWVLSPYLQFRYFSTMETAVSLGPMWATEKYHAYYYQVDGRYATASRPEYDARGGYSGFRVTLTNSHRVSRHWWWGIFVRYDSLSGVVFEDSPLVRQQDALMGGFAVSYVFSPVEKYYEDQLE